MVLFTLTKVCTQKNISRNKREHFIKELIHQDDITILNAYVPNNEDSKIPGKKSYQIEISNKLFIIVDTSHYSQ